MEDFTNKFFATFGSGSNIFAVGGLSYQGTWDALNNVPLIQSGVGTTGQYYVVSVAGNTNIDGISDWDVGDWIIFNGTAWQKIDNSDQVTSVNGLQGAVSIGLNSVLGENNTTGANNISVNSGQYITWNNGGFQGRIIEGTFTSNRSYSLPDATGTIALTSDPSGAIYLNDLADVTTGLPVPTSIVDDGRLLYYSNTLGEWITKEEITFSTIVLDAKKSTAGTIAKGTPVYLAGFNSDVITIEEADASNPAKMNCIGVSVQPINDTDADKHIIKFGKLTGLNTTGTPYGEVWNVGDILWVASGGGFTKTRPTGTAIIQRIAQVLKVDATGGQLEIFNTWRSSGLPNLAQNKTWVGDVNGYPVETDISTFNQNLSQVLGVGNRTEGNDIIFSTDVGNRKMISNNATPSNQYYIEFGDGGVNSDYVFIAPNNTQGGLAYFVRDYLSIGYWEVALQGANAKFDVNGITFSTSGAGAKNFDIERELSLRLQSPVNAFWGTIVPTTLTADRTYTFQDASGIVAFLSDIPASLPTTSPLSVVLTNGNTTGANNIIVTSGQDIRGSVGGNTLNLSDPFASVGQAFSLTQDNGQYLANGGWIYSAKNNGIQVAYQLQNSGEAIGIGIWASGISPFVVNGKEIGIHDNRSATAGAGLNVKRAVFIGHQGGSINLGLTNVVVVGGASVNAKVSNALYSNELRLQAPVNNFDGILGITTLTADRNYTLQDASGTLAFLTDIPSTPTLSAVLLAGNTTSGRDIRITNGDWIETDNSVGDRRMTIRSINGGANPDTIAITRRVSGSPIPTFSQPSAQITISDDINFGIYENNGYSQFLWDTSGNITFLSANPTKDFTIDSSFQFRLGVGGSYCNLNASGNATLTFPTGTGTIALTSNFQTGQTYTPTNVVTDRSFDANSTTLNEIADILGTLIQDLQSVNILS